MQERKEFSRQHLKSMRQNVCLHSCSTSLCDINRVDSTWRLVSNEYRRKYRTYRRNMQPDTENTEENAAPTLHSPKRMYTGAFSELRLVLKAKLDTEFTDTNTEMTSRTKVHVPTQTYPCLEIKKFLHTRYLERSILNELCSWSSNLTNFSLC